MKKITAILIIIMMIATCFCIIPETDCYAIAKTKYIKIKQVTYEKMQKTIASQKKTIASQKKTITAKNKTIATKNKTITSQKTTITNKTNENAELQNTIKEKKSTISWLWSNLEDFGYKYNYDTHKWEPEKTAEEEPPEPLNWIKLMQTEDIIPVIEEQMQKILSAPELTIDIVEIIDSWKTWTCYYVQADGDLYCITMKKGVIDVCVILN